MNVQTTCFILLPHCYYIEKKIELFVNVLLEYKKKNQTTF